ncbi:triose-phosphate isomerase [Aromatoleum diolicum]|uniref:Triosephosphate isomerase n=1 Tax=Aromatoleum diolicum TaxID=75796 RepID=A0ABX1QC67_9RHOO|nr:triose-phosphate isomerase [Aromatoleum diolicum]NMG74774.1 triose-phosphate isomerase [Aromatoleum diolicum]
MKRKLVVGNWKMNGDRERNQILLREVLQGLPVGVECAICVPFPYLAQAESLLGGTSLGLGAQTLSEFDHGAHTGEVSGAMLADFSVRYVIVGHSERRALQGESDSLVARKALAALRAGLIPLVCIGETLAEREAGETENVLQRQLDALAEVLDADSIGRIAVAYEPVWAIGTGRAASVEQVQAVLSFVRAWLAGRVRDAGDVRILYGGSVKADSAQALFGLPDADGGLIGGASLEAPQFLEICEAAVAAS